ncbi:MAG: hypothetical protein IT258_20340 [Saprospiraceae bacterium]|nr:hypothetical protein [Saprospiraceae bacterium]
MTNSQLLRTFKSLSKQDRSSILALVNCSFFNTKKEASLLCKYLAEQMGKPEHKLFEKEKLHAAAFPGKPFNDVRLRQTMAVLMKLIERYLIIKEMESSGQDGELYLLKALRERGIEKRFDKKQKHLQTLLAESPKRDARSHMLNYSLASEEMEGRSVKQRSSQVELHPLHNHLTSYYLSEMLRHACSALTHQAISAQVYDMDLLRQVLMLAEQFGVDEYPAIAIYYHACKALQQPENRQHFDDWKACLAKNERLFSNAELRGIYLIGINFCIRRMNKGDQIFIKEAFDLYRAALELDLLSEKGHLTAFTFKNIIRIATALNDHDWAKTFFESYQNRLPPAERENIVRYNLAFLYFRSGNYNKAMPLLQQVNFDDTLNNLDARRMLLRSYFELGETSALDALLHSFGTYLNRQKDIGYHRDLYLNLIRFIRQWREAPKGDTDFLKKLEEQVRSTELVAEKEWLLLKLKEGAQF